MSPTSPLRYAFLGPEGTFSEAALLGWLAGRSAELLPYATVNEALDALHAGEASGAMVPIENSVEGSVSATLDALAYGEPLTIVAEAQLPVTFSLLARPGRDIGDVKFVTSHPHAEAQCRRWLAENLPDARFASASSTAAAAADVADPASRFDAAISSPLAADVYGLTQIAEQIGDNPAETRFILVGTSTPPPLATGADKTSLALFMGEDHPGALLEILTEFAVRGVNLTRIESRPTGGGMGDYYFSVDLEGHVDDARVGEALTGLQRVCAEVRFLGSYPRVDGRQPTLRRGVSDEEFRSAGAWLARIREGRPQ